MALELMLPTHRAVLSGGGALHGKDTRENGVERERERERESEMVY